MMKKLNHNLFLSLILLSLLIASATTLKAAEKVNYYYESGALLDMADPTGDDKGPGYYQYPLDKRMRRGVFDLKRFTVYEEGQVIVFEIQMRNYIMREWPDTNRSEDQGFVANLWDIYIDIDGAENSGYQHALPGRDLNFTDKMGWEKSILVSPLSEYELFDILRNKTDELDFQNRVDDIVYPDYIKIQRDKAIIKISKLKLPGISAKSGFQCLAMGYKKIVSPNRLLNRDVRAFATDDDFGGGHDSYGDPPVMDIIVPEGEDQYKLLRNFRSEPYREDIEYAAVPFVYADGKKISPAMANPEVPLVKAPAETLSASPVAPKVSMPVAAPVKSVSAPVFAPIAKPVQAPVAVQPAATKKSTSGFVPLKPVATDGFKPMPKSSDGFIPVKKKK